MQKIIEVTGFHTNMEQNPVTLNRYKHVELNRQFVGN